jgi:type II secretory pathway pseudopilin PulG
MKLKQRLKNSFSSPEAGYTIIEGLVAMIMVAALMSAVAPIIAYSVGTRVQARKVELAAQAARSYIDAVRKGQINPPNGVSISKSQQLLASPLSECWQIQNNELQYCQSPLININDGEFYCVDNDDDDICTPDSLTDMMVHGAISLDNINNGTYKNDIVAATPDERQQLGYILQVKVYRAKAFSNTDTVILSNDGVPFTVNNSGLATKDGETERPLFVTKTEMAPTKDLFQNIKDRTNKE